MRNGLVVSRDGDRYWYQDDLLHREDGPAIEYSNGDKEWIVNNEFHRLEGPAIINISDGTTEWYIDGERYNQEEHLFNVFRNEHNLSDNYNEWPGDMKVLFELIYR